MSIRLMELVWECPSLTSTETLIMLALANYANDEGRSVYPSKRRVAERSKVSERYVIEVCNHLVERGFLAVESAKPGRVTHYRIVVESLSTPELSSPLNCVHPCTEFTPTPELSSGVPLNCVHPIHQYNHHLYPPDVVIEKKETKKKNAEPPLFVEFYNRYPKKEGRAKAVTAFRNLTLSEQKLAVKVIPAWVAWKRAEGKENRYLPNPATWLNQERFMDEVPERFIEKAQEQASSPDTRPETPETTEKANIGPAKTVQQGGNLGSTSEEVEKEIEDQEKESRERLRIQREQLRESVT